ncbi:MAG: hypothetical protein ACI3VB_03380 [Oscillospiraceae bacterium]
MSISNGRKLSTALSSVGLLVAIISLALDQYSALLSNIVFGVGAVMVIAGMVIRYKVWRCPYCKIPLPFYAVIKHIPDYKCDRCGKHIDI